MWEFLIYRQSPVKTRTKGNVKMSQLMFATILAALPSILIFLIVFVTTFSFSNLEENDEIKRWL